MRIHKSTEVLGKRRNCSAELEDPPHGNKPCRLSDSQADDLALKSVAVWHEDLSSLRNWISRGQVCGRC